MLADKKGPKQGVQEVVLFYIYIYRFIVHATDLSAKCYFGANVVQPPMRELVSFIISAWQIYICPFQ